VLSLRRARLLCALAIVAGCSREPAVTRDPAPSVLVDAQPPAALLANALPLFRKCIEPGVVGEIELALTAGADGTVSSRKVVYSSTHAPELDLCVSGVAAMMKFNGPGEVRFTVTMSAG